MITLVAVESADGFIRSPDGNGNFGSAEDKAQLREFLHSSTVDAFVLGRKTFDEFAHMISYRPCYVLTRKDRENYGNVRYIHSADELPVGMDFALLGGAQTFRYFLELGLVTAARITTELSLAFGGGLPLGFDEFRYEFDLVERCNLAPKTVLSLYMKKSPIV